MPSLIAHNFYHQNTYPVAATSGVTIESGVSLVALVVHATTNAGASSFTSATLGGAAVTSLGNTTGGTSTNIHVMYLINPAAGTHSFAPTFSAGLALGYTLEVFQFSGSSSLSAFQQTTYASSGSSPVTRQITLTDKAGLFAVVTGLSYDDGTINVSAGVPDADFTAGYTVNNTYRQIVSGYIASVADASETYDVQFTDSSLSGGTINSIVVVAFIVDVAQPSITSVDSDDSISQGQQGIVINVANIPSGQVPIRAGAHGTAGIGGTDFTGLVVTPGVAGAFAITANAPVGIATSTSTQCYVEYDTE